eukprot:GEMP01027880.1.p1 GENE.GEMP01027880.1~~GEMP01027880.1.p1  ORF type:complete len:377 (+),score=100.00 GEMP01027880.1:181-1311(+)
MCILNKFMCLAGTNPNMAKPVSSALDVPASVKKVKKRKKNKENGDLQLSIEEQARRELQRQVRDLVLRLKDEGKSDGEIEAAKSRLKKKLQGSSPSNGTHTWSSAANQNDNKTEETKTRAVSTVENGEQRTQACAIEKNDATAEKKSAIEKKEKKKTKAVDAVVEKQTDNDDMKDEDWREKKAFWEDAKKTNKTVALGSQHDIVVIPICWRGRHDHLAIVAAAQKVKDILAQQGLDAWVDSRRQYKPGQKFAYWEHLGLKYRVEVGPEDLQQNQCKVCKHGAPGDYQAVQKVAVPLPPRGAKRLLVQLKRFGMDKLDAIIDNGRDDVSDEDEDDGSAHAEKVSPKKQERPTGDAMDENYVLEDRSAQKKKKKPRTA